VNLASWDRNAKLSQSEHTVTTKCEEAREGFKRPAGKGSFTAMSTASKPLARKYCFLTMTLQREKNIIT
jgi:hypothetical protein